MSEVQKHLSSLASMLDQKLVADLIQIYFDQMKEAIPFLEEQCEKQDFEKSKFLCHKLKSSSRNTGSTELADLFLSIEKNPKENLTRENILFMEEKFQCFKKEAEIWLKSIN